MFDLVVVIIIEVIATLKITACIYFLSYHKFVASKYVPMQGKCDCYDGVLTMINYISIYVAALYSRNWLVVY